MLYQRGRSSQLAQPALVHYLLSAPASQPEGIVYPATVRTYPSHVDIELQHRRDV